jgi:zinc transport system permease protein
MIVALGIKLVGTLLMGALTVIPAAVAKNVSRSMRGYVILSALLGGVISVGGMWVAEALRFLPGPSIILFGVGLFLLSLTVGRKSSA